MKATNEIHIIVLKHQDEYYQRKHFVLQDETKWLRRTCIPSHTPGIQQIDWLEVSDEHAEQLEIVYQRSQPTIK